MRQLIRLLSGSIAVALLLAPAHTWAQQDTTVIRFSEDQVDVIQGSPEDFQRLENTLLIGDQAIQLYLVESTRSIQQGHRHGFAEFRDWYRSYQKRQEQANEDLLKSIFGLALKGGLNIIFPGSGTFIDKLKEYSVQAYDLAVNNLGSVDPGDVNQFLDRHEAAVEGVITGLLDVPDQFRNDHPDIIEAAKWEFVFEKVGTTAAGETPNTELGPETRRMLAEVGVPEPGSATANRFKERVLERQIRGVFAADEAFKIMHSDWEIDVIARVTALRHLDPENKDRYCQVEQALSYFWQSPECRGWEPPSR